LDLYSKYENLHPDIMFSEFDRILDDPFIDNNEDLYLFFRPEFFRFLVERPDLEFDLAFERIDSASDYNSIYRARFLYLARHMGSIKKEFDKIYKDEDYFPFDYFIPSEFYIDENLYLFNHFLFNSRVKNLRITKGLFLESLKSFFIRELCYLINYRFFLDQNLSFFKTSNFSYLSSMVEN